MPTSRSFPGTVERGATLGVVSPSSPVTPKLEDGLEWLQSCGFEVVLGPNVWNRRGILAGRDAQRVRDLEVMFADHQIDAVLASGGGYGTHRLLLEGLELEVLRDNPKPLVGFSDITGLHIPLWMRLGMVTVHGPNVSSLARLSEEAQKCWLHLLTEREPLGSIDPPSGEYTPIVTGEAEGLIVGGNIALVCTLLGTPYELDTTDRILFLENVDDRAYRFDRYLAMLRLAGKLQACRGIIFGSSVELTSTGGDGYSTLEPILREHLQAVDKPALYGFPAGHLKANYAFPLGTRVTMSVGEKQSSVSFHEALVT